MRYLTFITAILVAPYAAGVDVPPRSGEATTAAPKRQVDEMPIGEARALLQRESEKRFQAVITEVRARMEAVQGKIAELRAARPASEKHILTADQKELIREFREFGQRKKIELKQIRRDLHKQTEELESARQVAKHPSDWGPFAWLVKLNDSLPSTWQLGKGNPCPAAEPSMLELILAFFTGPDQPVGGSLISVDDVESNYTAGYRNTETGKNTGIYAICLRDPAQAQRTASLMQQGKGPASGRQKVYHVGAVVVLLWTGGLPTDSCFTGLDAAITRSVDSQRK